MTSTATIVAPTGVPIRIAVNRPITVQTTEKMADTIVTFLKLLKSLIADKAGKTIKAEIRREPTRFIAKTMTTAMTMAIRRLCKPALTPTALEKPSSKVMANILL